jgi:type IV fimbrial biogenesis protein FimT
MFMFKQKGMTLIEVMVTLVIAGVIMAYAVPSFRDFFLKQSINNKANDMLIDFAYARTEAINKGISVRVTATGGDWKDGWEIATDTNRNGAVDGFDEVLRITNSVELKVTITDEDMGDSVFFSPTGSLKATNARVIVIKHEALTKNKNLRIALSGSASIN